jgi:uncharacterized protein (DUF1330 family)
MTAFYILQHEIEDEVAFAAYLEQTMPFIQKYGGRYLLKPARMKCSRAEGRAASLLSNFRASRPSRIGTTIPVTGH